MLKRLSRGFALVLAQGVVVLQAGASEGIFGYTYTLDNTPRGNWEYEQKHTWREGKARGRYHALDLRNEFEYGITNDLQVAFYLENLYLYQKDVLDPEDTTNFFANHDEFNIRGASVEFLYRAMSVYRDVIGLGFYLEPEISVWHKVHGFDIAERAIEGRIIVQKNFLDDTLITAFNLMLEPEWTKENGLHGKELYAELSAGLSYRFKPKWFVGFELRNHAEFPDMNLGNQEHSAYFAGANIHYGNQRYWWTLTALPQIYGWPQNLGLDASGNEVKDKDLHLGEHERFEVRFMFGIPLATYGASDGLL